VTQRLHKFQRLLGQQAFNGLVRLGPMIPDRAAMALDRFLGGAVALAQPQRSRVLRHLEIAFGREMNEGAIRRVATGFYRHASHLLFETLRFGKWTGDQVLDATEISGIERLEAAEAQGRGVIIIGGHIGNFEIGGAGLARRGHPISVVSDPQRSTALEGYLGQARQRHDVSLIRKDSLRDCFQCLRQGGRLVLMIDQRQRMGGVIVPFFGHPAASAPGPAAIALKTGAPVISISACRIRDSGGQVLHHVEIGEPVELVRTGDREQDIALNTARFQLEIEAGIRRAPEQWFWNLNRWGLQRVQPRRGR